jgi:hypothetical protein
MVYRMSRKTSIYLNPQLENLADAADEPLSEALYRGLRIKPLLIEESSGGFITHWYCAIPGKDVKFRVPHDGDHWLSRVPPVREIYEIEITDEQS